MGLKANSWVRLSTHLTNVARQELKSSATFCIYAWRKVSVVSMVTYLTRKTEYQQGSSVKTISMVTLTLPNQTEDKNMTVFAI